MAQDDRQTGQAFTTNYADLDVSLAGSVGDDRRKATVKEVDSVDPAIACLQLCENGKIDRHEVRFQQRIIRAR